jgi:biopolymer transport protein ExbB/TolQ
MTFIDLFLNYMARSSFVTVFVLSWLSLYFIATFWLLIGRYLTLSSWMSKEQDSLESMLIGNKSARADSILSKCINDKQDPKLLQVCRSVAEKNVTSYLVVLSVIASTAPFIGLFGTVVSILESFAELGNTNNASLNLIAPVISEALVATAAGIFVAIPAYSFHLILKRIAYNVMTCVDRQIDIITVSYNSNKKSTQVVNENVQLG